MSLRRWIAEKVPGLKKAGVELPIISEVAVPARIVRQRYIEPRLVRVAGIPDLGKLLGIPSFAYGEAYGETAGLWYRVTYPKAINGAVPVCAARARTGTIIRKAIGKIPVATIPPPKKAVVAKVAGVLKIAAAKIPAFTIPRVGIRTFHCTACGFGYFALRYRSCPECGADRITPVRVEELTGADRYEETGWYRSLYNAKKRLGDWGLLNWARDRLATIFSWLGYYFFGGNGAFVLADALSAQTDEVRKSVNAAISKQVDNINAALSVQMDRVNDRFSDLRDNANVALLSLGIEPIEDLRANINEALARQMELVADRVNLRLDDLYAIWGIPSNMSITPVHTRNETDSGFDFQSFGKTTIHYIAIGGYR